MGEAVTGTIGDLVDQLHGAIGAPRLEATVDLGGCSVRFLLSEPAMRILDRFEQVAVADGRVADFEVACCTPDVVPAELLVQITQATTRTARGRNLRRGYYATDNFGPPADLVSDGRRFVIIADDPEPVVWSYLVKYLLLRWSSTHESIFLKAAAVERDGHGVLLVARGGGGKTTMAMALAARGSGLIANSHVLIRDGVMTGVATAIRVRELDPSDPSRTLERVVSPQSMHLPSATRSVPLSLVCLVARTEGSPSRVEHLQPEVAEAVLTSFALGLDVYRLEEDLLDHLGGDYELFARASQRIRARITEIAERFPVVRVDHDVLRTGGAEALAEMLWPGA